MNGRTASTALLLLVAALIAMASAAPVYAQSGLTASFATTCVTSAPGATFTDVVTITDAGAASGQAVTVKVVGSIPKDSTATVTPSSGTAPLEANFTVAIANDSDTAGSYQEGVVVTAGSQHKILFIALHVEKPGQTATACSTIGLPLPESTLLVTFTSVCLGLFTQAVTRRFVDLDAERRMKAELNEFNKEKREATLAKDKAKLEKLKKKELAMMQARTKVQMARTKVTFITIVPLFLIYYLMASFLGGYGSIVAVSPIPIPYVVGGAGEMVLFWWYIIGSFTLSSLLSRLMHTNT